MQIPFSVEPRQPGGYLLPRTRSRAFRALADPFHSSGIDHIKLGTAIAAASERFKQQLPADAAWPDISDAAWKLRKELRISQESWGDACHMLGRQGAALCLIVTDQASQRSDNSVRQPPAYFRGMLNKARSGQLQLHKSIFGLAKRNHTHNQAAAKRQKKRDKPAQTVAL